MVDNDTQGRFGEGCEEGVGGREATFLGDLEIAHVRNVKFPHLSVV